MKKVSIVIPTFNQGQYLPACVDHVLFQTYSDLEIIIVDGGSTDGTKKYLAGLQKKIFKQNINPVSFMDEQGNIVREKINVYPENRKLKIIIFDEDIGATRTYNEGFRVAEGEYITYIVGDDLPHPHMIEELVREIEITGADFVYSDVNLVNDAGEIVRQIRLPDYKFKRCFADWYHLGVSHLYKAKWHDIAGLMDGKNYKSANDYDHYLRFAMNGAVFKHLPKILYSVRYHGDNRSTGQHTNDNYKNLLEESKKCAFRARKYIRDKYTI